jgi:hypothetical protein
MKKAFLVAMVALLLGATAVMVTDALAVDQYPGDYPDCYCRYYPRLTWDNCDPGNRGNCCPNPCGVMTHS